MSGVDLDTSQGERPERIAKLLARAGLCSRRDAESWIAERLVATTRPEFAPSCARLLAPACSPRYADLPVSGMQLGVLGHERMAERRSPTLSAYWL